MTNKRVLQKEKSTKVMLEAALNEFSKKGFSNTRLSDIAKNADVAKGLVSSRFGSKENLFNSLSVKIIKDYLDSIDTSLDAQSYFIQIARTFKDKNFSKSPQGIILFNIVNNKDIPDNCVAEIQKAIQKSSFYSAVQKAYENGEFINKSPQTIIWTYIKSTIGIIESYSNAGLELPSDKDFLNIILSDKNKKDSFLGKINHPDKKTSQSVFGKEIISAMLVENQFFFRIDLSTGIFFFFNNQNSINSEEGKEINYEEYISYYIKNNIHPDDVDLLLEKTKISYLRKTLKEKPSFSIIYRDKHFTNYQYFEAKFLLVESKNSEPTIVTATITNKDDETYKNIITKNLLSTYSSIFFVDLQNETIRTIIEPKDYKLPIEHKINDYSKFLKDYATTVSSEYKETWINMSNPSYMRQFLSESDTREYIYSLDDDTLSPNSENHVWKRSIATVTERKNGEPVCFILTFSNIDSKAAKTYELNKKISDQKMILETQAILLEEALRRAEKASDAKTNFLANLSHDIRTPMNAIMGFTSLALKNQDNPEKVHEFLSKSLTSSKHLLNLIDDILDMSRIESGKLQLQEAAVGLKEILKEISTIFYGQTEAKHQTLYIDDNDITDKKIICDKVRLHQVLINLLNNSVKFTPEDGNIILYVRQTSCTSESASFEFHVKDNGIGMSSTYMEKLFHPFEKDKSADASKLQGPGLGLAISKNIIDLMGGSINVISEPGKGTEVIVYLTFKLQQNKIIEEDFDDNFKLDYSGFKILLVDDNPFNLDITKEMLSDKGFIVETAENGQEALEKIQKYMPNKYAAVLMDVQMPVLNGYEATLKIRKLKGMSKQELPIIAATANAFAEDRFAAFESGMNALLTKPIKTNDLFRVLKNCLKGDFNYG